MCDRMQPLPNGRNIFLPAYVKVLIEEAVHADSLVQLATALLSYALSTTFISESDFIHYAIVNDSDGRMVHGSRAGESQT